MLQRYTGDAALSDTNSGTNEQKSARSPLASAVAGPESLESPANDSRLPEPPLPPPLSRLTQDERAEIMGWVRCMAAAQVEQQKRELERFVEQKIETALAHLDASGGEARLSGLDARKEENNKYLAAFDAHEPLHWREIPSPPQTPPNTETALACGADGEDERAYRQRRDQYRALIACVARDFRRIFFQDWSAELRAQRPFMNSVQRNFLQDMIAQRFQQMENAWHAYAADLSQKYAQVDQNVAAIKHALLEAAKTLPFDEQHYV